MPNRFTAVPSGPVPPAARGMAPVLAVADLFMGLMLSRPGRLSLRSVWVTPGTLLLAGSYTLVSVLLAVLLLTRGGLLWLLVAIALIVLSIGSAAVAAVGVSQRRSGG